MTLVKAVTFITAVDLYASSQMISGEETVPCLAVQSPLTYISVGPFQWSICSIIVRLSFLNLVYSKRPVLGVTQELLVVCACALCGRQHFESKCVT